jgi:hypothetical protein
MPSIQTTQRVQATQLLEWMRTRMPHVYRGVAGRFSTQQQLSGFWDSIGTVASSVVTGVTNFINTQGAEKLLQVAQPFIQNKLEKEQIALNLQRIQTGQPVKDYSEPAAPLPGYGPAPATPAPAAPAQREIPWGWIGGGAAGVALLLMLSRGSSRRR